MKTVFGIKNKFQSNHSGSKSTAELSSEHWFFEKSAWLQMLDCLKCPFGTHAALLLEGTSNNKNVIRDYR